MVHGEAQNAATFNGEGMSLSALICTNGFGHFGRATNILDKLTDQLTSLKVTIFSSEKQAADKDLIAAQNLRSKGVRFVSGLLEPGVEWSADPATYDDGRLVNWMANLGVAEIDEADLVLSDNLPGILARRHDAVLSGNFLWHDVIGEAYPDDPAVMEFVEHDSGLLSAYRPPMICVDAIASPAVREETEPVGVGWMLQRTDHPAPKDSDNNKAVVFGGGVSTANEILTEAAERLAHGGDWNVHVQPKLRDKMSPQARRKTTEVNNSYNNYDDAAVVVGRPGVGTMTACVEGLTPLTAVHEGNNSEMIHNGERIEALGIGRHPGTEIEEINTTLKALTRGAEAERVRRNLQGQSRNGIAQAAQWLADRLVAVSQAA